MGKPANQCPKGKEKSGSSCYNKCKKGYTGIGLACWMNCPASMLDQGAFCYKLEQYRIPVPSYSEKECLASTTHNHECYKGFWMWYEKCKEGFSSFGQICKPECPKKMEDIGISCTKHTY